jgi:hypothetical protein
MTQLTRQPIRAEVREPNSGSFVAPTVPGEIVRLKCDPARKEARFDLSDKDEQTARHVAALQQQAERMNDEDRGEAGPR